jgi:hypothetical protein
MLLWSMLARAWQADRSENEAARLLGLAPSTLSNWKDRVNLPPSTKLDEYADRMGIPRDEAWMVVRIERRAKAQGLELFIVLSVADDGFSAELEPVGGGPRIRARVEPTLVGAPIHIRAGDVAASDGDIVCWTASDDRAAIEAQRQRVAALPPKPETCPPRDGDATPPASPIVGG